MPVVEIFIRRGRTPEQVRVLADAVHDALVDAYEVPDADRFQIVNELEPHQFIFDPHFMGGPRTDGFVLVRVMAGKPRPTAMKRKLFSLISDYVHTRAGISPVDVFTIVDNVQLGDLSLSEGRPFDVVLSEQQ